MSSRPVGERYPFRKTGVYEGVRYDIRAASQKELDLKLARKINEIDEGYMVKKGSTTVSAWFNVYLDKYVAERVSFGVISDRRSMFKNHIKPYIGSMALKDVNSGHCQTVVNQLNGMSKDRIDKCCQLLFNMFKKAKAEKLIKDNPAEDLVRPLGEDGRGRAATEKERALALLVAKDHPGGLWIRTILYCGFRPGETDRFKGGHINYDEGLVFVDGTKSAAARRIVPAPPELLDDFKALGRKSDEFIFKNTYGDMMRKSSRAKLWNSFKREMNIRAGCAVYRNQLQEPLPMKEDLVPYCFRHSFATDLKDAGIPFGIRQELLGHSGRTVTDNYTHRTEESLRTAARLLSTYRKEQALKIKAIQDEILRNGYKEKAVVTEDLAYKYFPDLV